MAYVIGYHAGTYGGYEPFKDIEVGDYYNQTEVVTVPETEVWMKSLPERKSFG